MKTNAQFIKEAKAKIEASGLAFHRIVAHPKAGTVECRSGYFCHHREQDERDRAKLEELFGVGNVSVHDHFACWPKESRMAFTVKQGEG